MYLFFLAPIVLPIFHFRPPLLLSHYCTNLPPAFGSLVEKVNHAVESYWLYLQLVSFHCRCYKSSPNSTPHSIADLALKSKIRVSFPASSTINFCSPIGMLGFDISWIGRVVLVLQLIPGIVGWGKEGHYAVCKIAEGYLSEDASAAVKALLPEIAEGDLANVCSWPDQIRFHYHWSGPLHYIDTPDFRCNYNYSRDCHDSAGRQNRCVSGAIYNYTTQLLSYKASNQETNYNLTEALMFLSHFIGDIHQPLHVGFTEDEGGNTIVIRWYKRKTNLHHVWDNMIIESALKTFYSHDLATMIEAIQTNITGGWSDDVSLWGTCKRNQTACPDPYASESIDLACKYAYRNATPGTTLGDDYFLSRLPVVEKRLAQGGVRLAATLNRIFEPKTSLDKRIKTTEDQHMSAAS